MNRYKNLLVHGICAALMTALEFRYGFISRDTIKGFGFLSAPDLIWETIHYFRANVALIFFLLIPASFMIQYVYFRVVCRESLEDSYNDRDASLGSLYASVFFLIFFLGSLLPSARAARVTTTEPLTFYGVEIRRQPQITIGEFEEFSKKNPQASAVLWRYPRVEYEGSGEVILAGYSPDRREAEGIGKEVPGSKIIEIGVSPAFTPERRSFAVYLMPQVGGEDGVAGDVWVRVGREPARLVQREVGLGYADAERNKLAFKVVKVDKDERGFTYCTEDCFHYDLEEGHATAAAGINPKSQKSLIAD